MKHSLFSNDIVSERPFKENPMLTEEQFSYLAKKYMDMVFRLALLWGDRIFEKCGIRRDEGGDGGKTLEIRGKRRLSARDGGANYQQS